MFAYIIRATFVQKIWVYQYGYLELKLSGMKYAENSGFFQNDPHTGFRIKIS